MGNALWERGNRNSCVQSRLVLSQRTLHNYLSFAFNEWANDSHYCDDNEVTICTERVVMEEILF